jgi:DNA-binding CsgD family transcriptional regulator
MLNFIVQSHAAKDDNELFVLLKDFVKPLGFDRIIFCLMTDHNSIGEFAKHGKITGYPEDWMKHYLASDYEKIDPIRKECLLDTQRIFTWDGIDSIRPFDRVERQMMRQADEAGLKNGVAISLRNIHQEVVALGFASSRGGVELTPILLSTLKLISIQFYETYQLLKSAATSEAERRRISLTARESEVLQWAAVGKSNPDIADILNISERVVNYHLGNCYAKLNANCKTVAVLKAMRLSLIKLDTDLRLPQH